MQKLTMVIAVLMLSLSACYYDNEEELYPQAGGGGCDTANTTYSGLVSKIVNTKCAISGCHAGASGQAIGNFENHANLKIFLDGQKNTFVNAINHTGGASPMPKGGAKLSACEILQIETWINKGYRNN